MSVCSLLRCLFFLPACFTFAHPVFSQADNSWQADDAPKYGFIREGYNKISNANQLNPMFERLFGLQQEHKRVVHIVHIGDSHIQADMMTAVLRKGFQRQFGDAGRGLVFPYQVARTNGPEDVTSGSTAVWKTNRNSRPEIPIATGISGYGMHTEQRDATFYVTLKGDTATGSYFDKIRLFPGNDSSCYTLTYNGSLSETGCSGNRSHNHGLLIRLSEKTQSVTIAKTYTATDSLDFYGLSLEKQNQPGIIYHTIGVNGAQYYQYNQAPMFWQHIGALRADCYIISLGTNEAQNQRLNVDSFLAQVDTMVTRLKAARPNAVVVLTTPPGSYFRKKAPNKAVHTVRDAIMAYCEQKQLSCWDLFSVTHGEKGTVAMAKAGILRPDRVHFSREGYELQGALLLKAFADSWNNWLQVKTVDR